MSRQGASRRRTVARHAPLRSPTPLGQALTLAGVVAMTVLVASAAVVAFSLYDLRASFAEDAVVLHDQTPLPPPQMGPIEGPFDLLVVGTDECEPELIAAFGARCTGPDSMNELNDVNVLLHVSDDPRRVTVVSFPRDLMVPVPSCTQADGSTAEPISKLQINAVYRLGGLACVTKTVSNLTQQNIQFAAKVSFGGVVALTSAVGGVEVCIGNDGIRDPFTGIDWPPGPRTIAGFEALQFLRTRYGVGDQSDLARIGNQQQYMSRLVRKLTSEEVLTNPATLFRLAATAADNITPTQSLADPLRMVQLALAGRDVPLDQIVFVQYPVMEDPSDRNRVVPDGDSAQRLWDALAANRPLQVSGEAGANGGVIEVTPPEAAPSVPSPDPTATPTPAEEPVVLPESITGSTAQQETCSAGNR
ncbi:LCP family protein [Microbacterium atlanticum]|uniref:LCP family protein n=1 Tax=Microbacterium atlanticum TaxID=2782168 RepID=UPI001E32FBB8|nr:LCP family protein [Microbacterium atlanticum]